MGLEGDKGELGACVLKPFIWYGMVGIIQTQGWILFYIASSIKRVEIGKQGWLPISMSVKMKLRYVYKGTGDQISYTSIGEAAIPTPQD
jgi:hypothetical protein